MIKLKRWSNPERTASDSSPQIELDSHFDLVPHTSYRKVSFQLEEKVSWQNHVNSLPTEFSSLPRQEKVSRFNKIPWIPLLLLFAVVILGVLLRDSWIVHQAVSVIIKFLGS